MRIIGGNLKGRVITTPKTDATRPMTDKVKAAIFDRLGDLDDMRVLDVYAGSGALGFEALSRGAIRTDGVEAASRAFRTIQKNIQELGVDFQYQLHAVKVEAWLAHPIDQMYNVIFADPPYEALQIDIIDKLASRLAPDGVLVVSMSSRLAVCDLENADFIDVKTYGDTAIAFYRAKK